MKQAEIFGMFKQHWARLKDEDSMIAHLSINQKSFCGIEKRHIGVYTYGFGPVEHIKESRNSICKACFKIWLNKQERPV